MPHYPQLNTGVLAQYPHRKVLLTRTVQNLAMGGNVIKLADSAGGQTAWDLHYGGLATAELAALESLFAASEGRLGTFTFLDPSGNLLAWSEDFAASAWTKGPLLQLSGGISDPVGGTSAFRVTNPGVAAQSLSQPVAGPGTHRYCFSIWARSSLAGAVTLRSFTASAGQAEAASVGPVWRRILTSGSVGINEEPVSFGVEVAPGTTVDLFGAQVEGQIQPSAYRRTQGFGGVYPKARFDQDRLDVVTEGDNEHAVVVRIVSS